MGEPNEDLRRRLSRLMAEDYIDTWLRTPVEALDGRRPIDLDERGLAQVVSELEYGVSEPPDRSDRGAFRVARQAVAHVW